MTRHAAGSFCWTDLGTSDRAGATAFYGRLMGWEGKEAHLPEDVIYTVMKIGTGEAAGVYQLEQEQLRQRVPPHWLLYVAVDDADAQTAQAKELGAKVVMDAYDVLDLGRMALLLDPTGALFALWQGEKRAGMSIPAGSQGALAWSELMTPDLQKAEEFYAELFGWKLQRQDDKSPYAEFTFGDHSIAGAMQIAKAFSHIPAHWVPYFSVEDCHAVADEATKAGGRVLMAPTTVAEGDTFAVLRDPQSAVFGIISAGD